MSNPVKPLLKALEEQKNALDELVSHSSEPKKSKQQIDQEYYQKNKEKKKLQQKERYYRKKEQTKKTGSENLSKYYQAESIKILISFKDYIELSKEKMKLWLDFNWTLKDCQDTIKEGFADVVSIMKLEQVAGKLVRDYWATAKGEVKQKSKSWNSLDYDEQQRLIKYWGYEKARIENGYIEEWEKLERQGDDYLKAISRAKFHEERGKIKCECEQCQSEAEIHREVKTKIKQEQKKMFEEFDKEQVEETEEVKSECGNCYQFKKVDSETGLCRKCSQERG